MRLSEERIESIASQITDALINNKLVELKVKNKKQVQAFIEKIILEDLKIEDEIEEEARKTLAAYEKRFDPSSPQYQITFLQMKERIAKRRNYIL